MGQSQNPSPNASNALTTLVVSPGSPSISLGQSEQFTATGVFSDGSKQDLTASVSWGSAQPSIATIASPGMAVAKATGTTTISASSGSVSGSAKLTVSAAGLSLVSIALTVTNPSLAVGTTEQLRATATFSDQSMQDVSNSVSWNSSPAGIVTLSSSGLATAKSPGTASLTATLNSITGTNALTVMPAVVPPPVVPPPTLVSIAVTPANPLIPLGLTQQLTATGTFSDGGTQNLSNSVSWSSAPAPDGLVAVDSSGVATAQGVGTATVTATSGSISGSATVAVPTDGVFMVDYFPNLSINDGQKKVVNDGYWGDTPGAGSICDLIYVFHREQLSECCGCYVTPNGARDFGVNTAFNSNDLLGRGPYNELIVKQISSGPKGASSDFDAITCSVSPDGSVSCGGACDPTNPQPLIGLHGWAVKTQQISATDNLTKTISTITNLTETNSQDAQLGTAEQTDLGEDCAAAIELGSGKGLCTCGTFD